MPTYVYKFIDTGETIEVQQAFTDPSLTEAEHPTTGETMPVKKVFLPVGVTFKGGGFYKTDSRNGEVQYLAQHVGRGGEGHEFGVRFEQRRRLQRLVELVEHAGTRCGQHIVVLDLGLVVVELVILLVVLV